MTQKTTIIIADDHPIVRQGMRIIIEPEDGFQILAECGDGEKALTESLVRQPDVVILDVDMPHLDGLEVLKKLREQSFDGKVILMTVHSDREFFDEALKLGANGYVLKDSATEDVLSAIRAVTDGKNYVSPALTSYLFNQSQENKNEKANGIENLSPTERRVLQMIAEYKTTNQIAEELFISPLTVKTHRRNISLKLNLEGNHTLMKFAVENQKYL